MLSRYRDLPIKVKLVLSFALTTTVALALVTAFFAISSWEHAKGEAKLELKILADVIGANSSAALLFGDRSAADEMLDSLGAAPYIELAILYDMDGQEFARYENPATHGATPAGAASELTPDISVTQGILLGQREIGTIVLHGSLDTRFEQLMDNLLTAVIATIVSLALALLIAMRLQRSITNPVQKLTDTLHRVSSEHDYSLRAPINQHDEIGVLADGLNNMLETVQDRDQKLEKHSQTLEAEVSERTANLQEVNEKLQSELEERKRIETNLKLAHEELKEHHEQSTMLSEMNDHLQLCKSVDEIGPVVTNFIRKLFPGWSGALYIHHHSKSMVEALVSWGQSPVEEVISPDDCWGLRQGHTHLVKDPAADLICAHCAQDIQSACLCVPMVAHGEILGLLHMRMPGNDVGPQPVPEDYKSVTLATAKDLALAVSNLRLLEALQAQSVRDPLTGLFNRRYLQETLDRELSRALRGNTSVGVIMLDIDHFKKFNDDYGHDVGDLVLKELGVRLKHAIRNEDIACRYGGEEFTIILPGINQENALLRAEALRQDVKTIRFSYKGKQINHISISLGVALSPNDGTESETLITAADQALYAAKRAGRDRVMLAGEETVHNNA